MYVPEIQIRREYCRQVSSILRGDRTYQCEWPHKQRDVGKLICDEQPVSHPAQRAADRCEPKQDEKLPTRDNSAVPLEDERGRSVSDKHYPEKRVCLLNQGDGCPNYHQQHRCHAVRLPEPAVTQKNHFQKQETGNDVVTQVGGIGIENYAEDCGEEREQSSSARKVQSSQK